MRSRTEAKTILACGAEKGRGKGIHCVLAIRWLLTCYKPVPGLFYDWANACMLCICSRRPPACFWRLLAGSRAEAGAGANSRPCLHPACSEGYPGARYYGGNEFIDQVQHRLSAPTLSCKKGCVLHLWVQMGGRWRLGRW